MRHIEVDTNANMTFWSLLPEMRIQSVVVLSLIHFSGVIELFILILLLLSWSCCNSPSMLQSVLNSDKFGPVTNSTTVITVQVHNRITYLSHLIDSLSASANIEKAVVVFSHDVWDTDINNLVRSVLSPSLPLSDLTSSFRSIKFCRVLQIFYPHSLQTNQDRFPGHSASDCIKDWSLAK